MVGVGHVQDAGHGQEDLVLARGALVLAALTLLVLATLALATLASATAAATASLLLVPALVAPGLVPVRPTALGRLDGGRAGGVSQVTHERGLGVQVVLGGVVDGAALLALRSPGSSLGTTTRTTRALTARFTSLKARDDLVVRNALGAPSGRSLLLAARGQVKLQGSQVLMLGGRSRGGRAPTTRTGLLLALGRLGGSGGLRRSLGRRGSLPGRAGRRGGGRPSLTDGGAGVRCP